MYLRQSEDKSLALCTDAMRWLVLRRGLHSAEWLNPSLTMYFIINKMARTIVLMARPAEHLLERRYVLHRFRQEIH
jgi:hypothetical protein